MSFPKRHSGWSDKAREAAKKARAANGAAKESRAAEEAEARRLKSNRLTRSEKLSVIAGYNASRYPGTPPAESVHWAKGGLSLARKSTAHSYRLSSLDGETWDAVHKYSEFKNGRFYPRRVKSIRKKWGNP